jgi:hypothetical protein
MHLHDIVKKNVSCDYLHHTVGAWFKVQYQIKLFYHQIMLARAGTKTTAKKQASLLTSTAAEMQETVLTPNTL